MADKLLVTTRSEEDAAQVRATGAEVLAEYPDALLVRATDDQARNLGRAGIETARLQAAPPVQTVTARFAFDDAVAADVEEPMPLDPDRTAYFIVQLVGPVAEGWLDTIRGHGVNVHGSLPGYRLLVGSLPGAVEVLRSEPFVEGVTSYRPAMKLSPQLRADVPGRELSTITLARVDVDAITAPESQQVQITVFDGESVQEVATRVRAGGGVVLSTTGDAVVAQAPPEVLIALAGEQGVQAILPFTFPEFTNDRATRLMGIPDDRLVGAGTVALTGAGQVIGVVDSGIDTGDVGTIHPDLRGRVTVVSSPNQLAALATDPPPFDDGPADQFGHGTHVAGSIAGTGTVAEHDRSATVPRGVAPEARLHVTAIGQRVNWNPRKFAPGQVPKPFGLWGIPDDLSDLFQSAYAAGARVHTNSWGSPSSGGYPKHSRDVDRFMFAHRDMLILFSAGNDGQDLNRDGRIDPTSIGSPGTAKNCLTVGASENDRPQGSTPTPGLNGT